MKLSVLITTYNLKDYVDETLESVINQRTEFEFEILVGDDGSTDGTIEIVEQWQERYPKKIKIFVMERDQKKRYNRIARASRNRIHLLEHAQGEYVIFLDGDDVYTDRDKLQKQVDVLDKTENQKYVACAHNIYVYWNEEKKYLLNTVKKEFGVSGAKYWKYGMYFHSDTIMFRNVFRKGVSEKIHPDYYDDNIIMYCLLEYGDIYYIPEVMANYRQLLGSSWNSVPELEKQIINLMEIDIEMKINPSLKQESVMRHLYSILFVWINSRRLQEELYQKYHDQMERDELKESIKWLEYRKTKLSQRIRMSLWLGGKLFRFAFIKLRKSLPQNRVNS